MNLSGVDLNLFVVFDAIYSERNLTRASTILNITQPAVSNALARLRDAFQDPLFIRSGRTMTPSPVAQKLIGPVRLALHQLRSAIDQSHSFEPEISDRVFNIGLRDTACTQLMPVLIEEVAQTAPGIRIQCPEVDRRAIAMELASGQLDLAIDIPELTRSDLKSADLFTDRYVCAMRRDHPLASARLTLERFLSAKHILVSGRRSGQGYVDIALGRIGQQANNCLRLTHFQPAFHVVMNTHMLLSAPYSLARKYDVTIKELPFPVPPLHSVLYWHRKSDQDPANTWLRSQILAVAHSEQRQRRKKPITAA